MATRKNQRPGNCLFCGEHIAANAGLLTWCEDGSPIYCTRHFDQGGWEIVCADEAACRKRSKQRSDDAKAAKAKRDADEAAKRAEAELIEGQLTARAAELLAGLEPTGYYARYDVAQLQPVIDGDKNAGRLPNQCGFHRIYKVEGGYFSLFFGFDFGTRVGTYWTDRANADACRLAWAQEHGITAAQAKEEVNSPYIGADQRRMYEVAAAHE